MVPEEEPIPEELEAVLPPDAPPNHRAHIAVTFTFGTASSGGQRCSFTVPGMPSRVRFQTTVTASGGSVAAAMRLARACYVLLEEGQPKDDVLQFRTSVYEKIKQALGKGSTTKKQNIEKAGQVANVVEGGKTVQTQQQVEPDAVDKAKASHPQAKAQEPKTQVDKTRLRAEGQSYAEREAAVLKLLGEESAGDLYRANVRRQNSDRTWFFKSNGFRFQTTDKAGGSSEVARQITCMCFARAEAGDAREKVVEYRAELYKRIAESGIPLSITEAVEGGVAGKEGKQVKARDEESARPSKKRRKADDTATAATRAQRRENRLLQLEVAAGGTTTERSCQEIDANKKSLCKDAGDERAAVLMPLLMGLGVPGGEFGEGISGSTSRREPVQHANHRQKVAEAPSA
eukprot:CAMPEP_0115338442 /NCGR_PEP_ID=MMETSP0270-20121206/90073_1 /TAXON_ID=71861 /ORGANISM="Scrippsiella trochoidea, Strain CCMP3099" /LENGTH=401 /DNA_ID=CAMNT_0002759745 /DNA_START=33 /DNA_END=1235 /DNA_ORIENTATION=+